jgi:hypothetical protein
VSVSGTGTSGLPRGFSWPALPTLRYCPSLPIPGAGRVARISLRNPSRVGRPLPLGRSWFPPASPHRSCSLPWYGILHPLSFDYALRPRLRSRLTLGGRSFPRNPWAFGGQDSHLSIRYSYRHSHFCALHQPSQVRFSAHRTLPYHSFESEASAICLAPLHFPRSVTRPVSYYALFQWWLLLSQHPGCLCTATSFPTQQILRGLSCRSGLFPS